MKRRRVLQILSVPIMGTLSGCADALETLEERVEKVVEDTVSDDLVRPPRARIDVELDGTILVLSLGTDTVGVMCGLPESDNPVQEVQNVENAVTSIGELECPDETERIVAINEAGDIEVVERV